MTLVSVCATLVGLWLAGWALKHELSDDDPMGDRTVCPRITQTDIVQAHVRERR
jgi:hypothetical protein